MRNLKKFLALVLAMIMVVSAAAVVSADFTDVTADNIYADAINDLAVKGIVKGTTDTTFGPTQDVERYQMALFMARALTGNTDNDADYQKGIVPFTDVTEYAGAIEYNYVNGIINGWTDITGKLVFAPKSGITYVQALKMAVCALGYTAEGADWTWAYYNKAAALGLTNNMDITSLDDVLNRAETAQIIYNMLYAVPADGGLTLAERNFDIQTAANTTTFVITATPKQYYAKEYTNDDYSSKSDVEGNYVGIQKLVNGLPGGEILYYTCEQLGIPAAEVENYFNRAIELVNFDAATKDFTSAVLGEEPKVVGFKDVTSYKSTDADNKNKLKIDGAVYTVDDMITGATLINEMVMYADNTVVETAKMLLIDEDGEVLAYNGTDSYPAGKLAYESSTGAKYFYNYATGKVISESAALNLWGVQVIDEAASFAKFQTMEAYNLYNDAYELKLYDDDRDGLYERAVYTPIYVGVYSTYLAQINGEERVADGLLKDLGNYTLTAQYVNYTDKAAQEDGAISVFTYNRQLNKVTVIDVLEVKSGKLTKINARGFDDRGLDYESNIVKLTIDGKEYTLAYDMEPKTDNITKWTVDNAPLGAQLVYPDNVATDSVRYNPSSDELSDIAEDIFFGTFNTKAQIAAFIEKLELKETYEFVEYNGYILMANKVEQEEVFDFAVVDNFNDFDLGEIYLDLYIGGKLEEAAVVTEIAGYELAGLSNYKFSMVLSKEDLFYPGTIYTLELDDDNAAILDTEVTAKNYTKFDLLNAKLANDEFVAALAAKNDVEADVEYPAEDAPQWTIEFNNGKSVSDRATQLRTDDDTVFYFIEDEQWTDLTKREQKKYNNDINEWIAEGNPLPENKKVTVFVGEPEDGDYIEFVAGTQIWVDKLGRGVEDYNGVANVVFVIAPAGEAINHNFFETNPDYTWVFMSMAASNTVEAVDAEDIGLDTEDYEEEYYAYSGNFVNMRDGSKVSVVYAAEKLARNATYNFILIDENGVAVDQDDEFFTWTTKDSGVTEYVDTTRAYNLYGIQDLNGNATKITEDGWEVPGNTGLNYFDWYYAHKKGLDYDGFEKVPTSILDVELTEDIIEVDEEDGYYVITDLKNNVVICDESDRVDNIKVFDLLNAKTGADAVKYLTSAPQVVYMLDSEGNPYIEDGTIVFIVATTVADK